MAKPTLLLLDGHSLAYRAFYALREVDMSTTTGQPTNAVFGFTSMLINLMRDEEPTHVAAAGLDVLICTGDRDALQLVNDQVTVLYPRRGVSDMTRFTPEEVQTK